MAGVSDSPEAVTGSEEVAPCTPSAWVRIDGRCCADDDENGVCDLDEAMEKEIDNVVETTTAETTEEETTDATEETTTEETTADEKPREGKSPVAAYLSSLGTKPVTPEFPAMLAGKDVRIIVGETGATVAAAINLQLYLANNGIAVKETRPAGDLDQAFDDFDGHTLIIESACGAYSEPLFHRCGELAEGEAEVRTLKHGSRYIVGFIGGRELDANDAVNAVITGTPLDEPIVVV
ncbi:hypothetical protein D6789_03460 [Candidatus Woesearchaeota archaeon]|nr:MAG: hypothetical protein D6789_03460 [Candidatus Woesearchaeota archaeon]